MKVNRLIAGLSLALCSILPMTAETTDTNTPVCVVVETTDGQRAEYLLTEQPQLRYDGQTVTFTTTAVTVEYVTEQVARVFFDKATPTPTAIAPTTAKTTDNLTFSTGHALISGLQPGEEACVCSPTGSIVATFQANGDGTLTIDLGTLPAGVSIIKTNQQSFKVTRK